MTEASRERSEEERLEELKADQRRRWAEGKPLRVEDYLAQHPSLASHADNVLDLIDNEVLQCRQRGQTPRLEEYQTRFPHLAGELEVWFGMDEMLPSLPFDSGTPAASPDPPTVIDHCPSCRQPVPAHVDTCPNCRTLLAREDVPPPTRDSLPRVADYQILGVLGRGGMGMVLHGHDPALGRDLAIKVLLQLFAGREDVVQRFREEAQVAGQLQHPSVVPVYELGALADGQPYFTMKLVKGDTLAALLRQRSDPEQDRPRFLGVFLQVCQGVAYAHAKGVIHRDLKPDNVMVGRFGEVQVMDWGLAKVLTPTGAAATEEVTVRITEAAAPSVVRVARTEENAATQEGDALGTPAYMPPEQALGEVDRLDERADVFSLGAVLCEILTGQPPYSGGDAREKLRRARRADLAEAWERLDRCSADPELTALARRCLAGELVGRPRNAGEVAREVELYRAGVEERARQAELERAAALARAEEARITAREAVAREAAEKRHAAEARARAEAERRARRLTLGLAAAALLLVLLGGGGAWVWQQRRATADAQTRLALEQGRSRLEDGWKHNDVGKLEAAVTEADKALGLAQSGASDALRQEAAFLHAQAKAKLQQAQKNADLLAALLNVTVPRETRQYVRADSGTMMAVAEPSVEEQFVQAFRRWDPDSDFDRTPLATLVSRLGEQPEAVVQQVVAGLGTWMLERRGRRPAAAWQRLFQVADKLDGDQDSRTLRQALVSGELEREAAIRALARLLPGSVLVKVPPGQQTQRLRQQAAKAARSRAPVLRLVTLTRALVGVGDAREAERLLRAAVTAQPNREVLLRALGELLERQGPAPREEAIGYYRAARALNPQLGIALGKALGEAGRPAEAEDVFVDLRQRQPNNPEMSYNLGTALYAQKRLSKAEAAYRKALELKPDYAMAYNNLGAVLYDQKRLSEAEAAVRKAIVLKPDLGLAYNNLGVVLDDQKRPAEAETAYRKAIKLQPDLALAYNNLGNVLHDQKKLAGAEAAFRKAIELQPDLAAAHYNLGNVLDDQKKPAEAAAAYRKAIALQPDFALAYINLGNLLRGQKKLAEAEAAYRKASAVKPEFPLAYYNLGNLLRDQKKLAEAEAAYRKAIELQPDYPEAYNNLGNVLRDQKKLAEAAYRKAIELKPDFAEAYNNLGNLLRDQKKLAEAEAAYRKAIELKPDYAEAYYNLGNVLLDQKKLAEAEASFRRAITLKPDLVLAYNNLGAILRDQRKLAEAEAAYRKALALQPDFAEAYNNLGRVLLDQKKLAEAEAAFRRADQLLPNHPTIRANLMLTKRLLELDSRLAAVQAGKAKPKDARERLELGVFCAEYRQRYSAAVSFCADAFSAEPNLAADLQTPYRFTAAHYAALAAAGKGEDAGKLNDRQRARLRKQALDWLRADLEAYAALADKPVGRALVRQRLTFWLTDDALAGVRDDKPLAALPETERKDWRKLWADVAALIKKSEEK